MNTTPLESAAIKLEIHDISLNSCDVRKKDSYLPSVHKNQITIQFMNTLKGSSIADVIDNDDYKAMLVYHYAAGFRAIPQNLPDEITSNEELLKEHILVEVKATFNAIYFAKEELSEEEIKAFGFSNVGFNVWPYWREFASSTANRLRLPHFIIPFKRMKDVKLADSESNNLKL